MTEGWLELLAAIVRGVPSLPGALCKRSPGQWDHTLPGETTADRSLRHEAAIEVCGRCPERYPCSRVDLGRQPAVIHAGVIHRGTRPTRRPA